MSIQVTSATADRLSGLLIDVTEGWDGFSSTTPAAINGAHESRAIVRNVMNTARGGMVIYSAVQTGPTMVIDNTVGRNLANFVSGASNNTRIGGGSPDAVVIPCQLRFQTAGAIPLGGAQPRPFRSYTLDNIARETVAGAALFEHGIGNGNANLPSLGAEPFAIWSSDNAVNAGRWRPRYRLINGGAITNGPDSGVTPATFHKFSIRYTEGAIPMIEWLLDDVPVFNQLGDVNMITITTKADVMRAWQGIGTPAGRTMQVAQSRFRVQEL